MSVAIGHWPVLILFLLLPLLLSCASEPDFSPPPRPVSQTPLVGEVDLQPTVAAEPVLDIALAVFDEGLGQGVANGRVFPTVRKAESLLLPVILAEQLRQSNAFGVVRVVHSDQVFMPLVVTGQIREADGIFLELAIQVTAADGVELFSRVYRDEALPGDYPVRDQEPFGDLYRAIANDLQFVVDEISPDARQRLERLSAMRFAAALAPQTFGRFLNGGGGEPLNLVSYPSADDPMLRRLTRIRRQDDLFIDAVDEQYSTLFSDVSESYNLWREYGFELQHYGDEYRSNAAERKRTARRGSYAAMQQVYASYRKVKIQEEDLRSLVQGFAGDALETVIEVDDGVFRLSGSVDDRYQQWQQILTEINALETGNIDQSP